MAEENDWVYQEDLVLDKSRASMLAGMNSELPFADLADFVQGPMIAMLIAGQWPEKTQARKSFGYFLEEVSETLRAVGLNWAGQILETSANQAKLGVDPIIATESRTPEEAYSAEEAFADGLADVAWTAIGALYASFGEEQTQRILKRVFVANMRKFPNGKAIIDPATGKYLKPEGWKAPDLSFINRENLR